MNHTYKPYTFEQMMADTSLDRRIVERIEHLVSVGRVRITAAKEGTFTAYAGAAGPALSYNAVLAVHIVNSGWSVLDDKHRPQDYLGAIAKILTQRADSLRNY